MIITRTPLRLSFFGGSCDYESYFSEHGPVNVIGTTINRYIYALVRRTPSILHHHTIVNYSEHEKVSNNLHINNNGVRGVLQFLNINYGLEITHLSDLPARTGLGSSSAFIVGLLKALYTLRGDPDDAYELQPRVLTEDAIHIERELLAEAGGVQDQVWPNYPGLNNIELSTDGVIRVKPVPVTQEFKQEFNSSLVMFYMGRQRNSFKIAESHEHKADTLQHKHQIRDIALEAQEAFIKEDIPEIGRLLNVSWSQKKSISPLVSTAEIDRIHAQGLKLGAYGGKLLGAGGSGFLLFVVPIELRAALIDEIGLDHVDFRFDAAGSQVIMRNGH